MKEVIGISKLCFLIAYIIVGISLFVGKEDISLFWDIFRGLTLLIGLIIILETYRKDVNSGDGER